MMLSCGLCAFTNAVASPTKISTSANATCAAPDDPHPRWSSGVLEPAEMEIARIAGRERDSSPCPANPSSSPALGDHQPAQAARASRSRRSEENPRVVRSFPPVIGNRGSLHDVAVINRQQNSDRQHRIRHRNVRQSDRIVATALCVLVLRRSASAAPCPGPVPCVASVTNSEPNSAAHTVYSLSSTLLIVPQIARPPRRRSSPSTRQISESCSAR